MFCSSAFSQDIDFDTTLIRDLDAKALLNFLDYPEYIKKKNFVSYKVEKLKYFDNTVDTTIMYLYNNNPKKRVNRYVVLDYFSKRFTTREIYKIRKKDVIIIDEDIYEFIYSKKVRVPYLRSNELITNHYLEDCLYNVPFYNTFFSRKPNIGYSKDSIIDGEHFKFFYYKSHISTFIDYGISYYHFVALCFNSQNLLEYIDINLAVPYTDFLKGVIPKRTIYRFTDYSFEDKNSYYDSIFDPNNISYKKYTKHDDDNPAYSYLNNTKDSILTDTLLNYPIVSLQNDTTTIKDEEGWLLLDFWFFGCRSCKEWIYSLKEERDSLGYLVLESKGIKIMSINSLSNNTEKIKKEMAGLDADYFTYHAKGINRYFHFKSMPYYILISPQKEIMFQGRKSDLGDYSEILRIVDSY